MQAWKFLFHLKFLVEFQVYNYPNNQDIMQKFLYFSLFMILLAFTTLIKAQDPMGLYYMQTIPQSSFINPAMQPRANVFFALPSINQNFKSDVAFKNIFQDIGGEWVTPLSERYDFSKLKRATGKSMDFQESVDMGLFGLGFRSGKHYFTVNFSVKNVMQTGLPYDLFTIVDDGLPDGKVFDFSTLRMKGYSYKEIALGYSREWDDKLTLGVKVKPLFGMMAAMTDLNTFKLETSRQVWNVTVSGNVSASAPLEIVEADDPTDFPESIDARDMESDDFTSYLTSFENGGLAFDFGGVYKFTPRLTFSAALVNLGYIKWKKDLNTLSFAGTYSFEGLNLNGTDDDFDDAMEDIEEDFKTMIDYKVTHEKFSTGLTPEFYAGALYEVTPSVTMGFLARSMFQKNNFRQDFNFSANVQPYSFVSVNLNYSVRPGGGNGLGTALSILLGPLQIYAMADYLPTRYSTVNMDGDEFTMFPYARNLSMKVGLNLIFGRHGYRDRPMLDSDK